MKQILQSFKTGEMWLADVPAPLCGAKGVVVRTVSSFVSAGTERMLAEFAKKGLVGKALQMPDQVKKVVRKMKTEGFFATLEKVQAKLDRPIPLGYSSAGIVVEAGRDSGFAVGNRVACGGAGFANHAEFDFVPRNLVAAIPDGVPFEDASRATVGAIALQGVRQCDVRLGESVAVAAEICRQKGRVVATGLVGMNLPRDLYYKKEVDFRLSCSYGPGRYDPVYEEQGVDYPFGYVRWTEQRNIAAFLQLVAEGKVTPAKLVTHRFKFDDALDAYELMLKRTEPYLGILLEYGAESLDRIGTIGRIERRVDFTALTDNPDNPVDPVKIEAVGVSFLGCGNFARSVLLPALKKSPDVSLRGVCTASGMSAGETGRKEGFAFATTDEAEVLKDAATDLVIVATRHDLHARQIAAALAAGKSVFCEKPLCISEEHLSGLINPDNPVNPVLRKIMVGFNRRYSPHAKLLKEYFSRRALPLVMHYRVNAGSIPRDVWIQDPATGGGRLVGEGCHFIDFMSYVCGAPVESVQAMCIKIANAAETPEDSVSVNLRFADGSVGTLEYVALGDTSLPKEFCEIHGEGSTATMDDFRTTLCSGRLGRRKLKGRQQKGFAEELAATVSAVKSGGPMPIQFAEIENVTQATFAALRAIKSGNTERVA